MITVTHVESRIGQTFRDHRFAISGVPMNTANTVLLQECLNDLASPYGDEAFTPKANGSSYTIAVRGLASQAVFADVDALQAYIRLKLQLCAPRFEARQKRP
jgi:hypothetical protein